VNEDYERHTGLAIIDHFRENNIDPAGINGVLQHFHAPFTWGSCAQKSLDNSIALEMCAKMALDVFLLAGDSPKPLPQHILDKHYLRKHGSGAYYGQGE